jgi:hypothetical protein
MTYVKSIACLQKIIGKISLNLAAVPMAEEAF